MAFVALSACQMTIDEPVVQPGPQTSRPSKPVVQPGPQASRPSGAEMRSACTSAAQAQRMIALQFGEFQTVTGSRGIEIGASSLMRVSRNGLLEDARCSYSFGDGRARVTSVDAAAGATAPTRPSTRRMRRACVSAAEDRGLNVLQLGDFETVTGSRGMEIGTSAVMSVAGRRGFQSFRCNYSFGDGEVRLTRV